MKALEILKEYSSIDFGCDMSENNKRIDKAISELEALQQHAKELEEELQERISESNMYCKESMDMANKIKDLESQLSSNPLQLTCKDCSLKLMCEKAQKSKDTFGTKLYEQWFSCFEKDTK